MTKLLKKPSVAILDEELPYPPDSGKRIRSFNLAVRLAPHYRITYVSHRSRTPSEMKHAETFLRDQGIRVVAVDRHVPVDSGPAFYARLAANLLSPLPYSVQRHSTAEIQAAIRNIHSSGSIDLWQVEWTPYVQNLRRAIDARWIVMAHNIESQIWQRYYETETNPLKRWYIGQQLRKYLAFEKQSFNEASQLIVVSEPDAILANRLYGTTGVEVVCNGVDVDYFQPSLESRDHRTILFVGGLFWRPNLDAVQVLLREVFPRVLAEERDARLEIVGRDPPPRLAKDVARYPNASLHPSVPDVRPFLRRAGVLAVPLRIGGGSRLKILEALACGCPVVSTDIGSEGLDLVNGRHYLGVDSVDKMVPAILRCIRNPTWAAGLAQAGRAKAIDYSWDRLAEQLGTIWEAQVRQAGRPLAVAT